MAKSKRLSEKIAEGAGKGKEQRLSVGVTALEQKHLGLNDGNNEPALVVLKYYQPNYQCLSDWSFEELRAFSDFITKFQQTTWSQIYASGGKNKTGFGYTVHRDRDVLPKAPSLDSISPEIEFFELRVTQKARVHGFRSKSAFFLVWLDRNHQVYPQ